MKIICEKFDDIFIDVGSFLSKRFECILIDIKRLSYSVATTQTDTQKTLSVRFCYRLTLLAFPQYLHIYTNAVLSHAISCHHSVHYIPKNKVNTMASYAIVPCISIGIRSIIDYVGLPGHCLSWVRASIAYNISISRHNGNCWYTHMFSQNNSAPKYTCPSDKEI